MTHTQDILSQIVSRFTAGERLALCTIIATRGSAPQSRGAKMLVLESGQTTGTLGGGCVEAEVRTRTLALLHSPESQLLTFKLDQDYGWDDGLVCGGAMDVLVTPIHAESIGPIRSAASELLGGRSTQLILPIPSPTGPSNYVEPLGPPPTLVIAGAGHVGQALAAIAARLEFDVVVIDDRPDVTTVERFPSARRIVGEIESELRRFPIDANTFVVIVTRGHKNDGQALHAVVDSPARYIGLIGSKSKIKAILDRLAGAGVSEDRLGNVHAPIGLDIGAIGPEEIALSIAAELVAVRRGRPTTAVSSMRLTREAMLGWINRPARSQS